MKIIQHSVFVAEADHPVSSVLGGNAGGLRGRRMEKLREQAEEFINGIGVDHVVSVTEHASSVGPYSVVVWWHREITNTDALVVRAADDKKSA